MLCARRIALGLTQQQLAAQVGTTSQQAHKYETGANRISAGRLYTLAHALGVEPDHFFEGLGSGEPAQPTTRQRQMVELARRPRSRSRRPRSRRAGSASRRTSG